MPIFTAAYVDTYASATPYITAAEYVNAPTAVDVSQLIPAGTTAANSAELVNVIARASSWVDQLCFQVLAATSTVETAFARVRADGTVRVPCRYWPILEVDSFTVGRTPSTGTQIADTADMWVDGLSVLVVPVAGVGSTSNAPARSYTGGPSQYGDRVYCTFTYVNGYPNTTTSTLTAAGVTALPVASALGFYAGTTVTIHDGAGTEVVTVASVTGTTLTLTAPTAFAHAAGVSVSNLPAAVKQATISLTSALIKTRGAEALVMGSIGEEASHVSAAEGGGLEDLAIAVDLLARFKRVM